MKIELKPHVGRHMITRHPVDLQQDRVFVDGELCGYVCRRPGSPINLIRPGVDRETQAAIADAVAAKYERAGAVVVPPLVVLPEPDGDDLDDDSDGDPDD